MRTSGPGQLSRGRARLLAGGLAALAAAAAVTLVAPAPSFAQAAQAVQAPPAVAVSGGALADAEVLVSCVVAPGFDFADFTLLPGHLTDSPRGTRR